MKTSTIIIVLILSSLSLMGCRLKTEYLDFQPLDSQGWNQDSVLLFRFDIRDTCAYNIYIHMRHTERYGYQNMWLFVQRPTLVDTMDMPHLAEVDTIEFYLANDRGQWLGNGKNGIIHMPVIYEEQYHFSQCGTYEMTLQQGMRCELLSGVKDMGIEIQKVP